MSLLITAFVFFFVSCCLLLRGHSASRDLAKEGGLKVVITILDSLLACWYAKSLSEED